MSKERLGQGQLRMRAEAVIYKVGRNLTVGRGFVEQVLDEAFPMGYEDDAVVLIRQLLKKEFGKRPKINANMKVVMPFVEHWRDARSTTSWEPQQVQQKPETRRRGRPKKTIKELIENDEGGERLNALKKAMNGKKGKGAAIVIRAAKKLGWMIEPPTFIAVKEEFGDIGHASGYNKYMSEAGNQITVQEIADAKKALEDMISQ